MRVLVVYGSTRGGTAGLAHMVADACAGQGLSTEVRRAGDVREVSDFDAVIVGGAIYSNRWHPEAVAFVGRHRAALQQLPVWFFSSGPLDDSARSGALAALPQVSKLAREVDIRGHMTFGGLLDKRPAGLFGMFTYGQEGDFRDRRHVGEWVERIASELKSPATVRVISIPEPDKPTEQPADSAAAPAEQTVERAAEQPDDLERPIGVEGRGGRLRRFLTFDPLDEADEDEGLDLFGETDDVHRVDQDH